MSDERQSHEATCVGKTAYASPQLARAAQRTLLRGSNLVCYRCATCGQWHNGNPTQRARRRDRHERRPNKNWMRTVT